LNYVLVHGAFHGGWCWERVAERLRAAGHPVHTPTLTGLGDRAHLLSSAVGLDTHIDDVVGVLRSNGLRDVVLVGHSYGGIVITGVADRVRERLHALVYLDGVVIDDGQTWSSIHPPKVVQAFAAQAQRGAALAVPSLDAFGIESPEDRAWVESRLTPHPAATYRQRLRLEHPPGNGVDRTYIDCTQPALPTLDRVKARVRAERGWRVVEIATGHDAMVTAPGAVSRILIDAGASRSR
jgi:pimeloyl-ACP methyl ester carboxylesterase